MCSNPDLGPALFEPHRAVGRFHGRVRQIRHAVIGFDLAGRCGQSLVGIAVGKISETAVAVQGDVHGIADVAVGQVIGFARTPFHRQLAQYLHRQIGRLGDHGNAGGAAVQLGQGHYARHAGYGLDLGFIKDLKRAADLGVHADHGIQEAGGTRINAEQRRAVCFGSPLNARNALTDQRELVCGLEFGIFRSGLLRGQCRQFAKACRFARSVRQHAFFDLYLLSRHLPLRRRCLHQHGACAGPGLAHGQPQVIDAGRTAGHHQADFAHGFGGQVLRHVLKAGLAVRVKRQAINRHCLVVVNPVYRGLFGAYLVAARIQFIGQHHGQRRMHTLSHFAAAHHHGDSVIHTDAYPAVEGRLIRVVRQRRCG